MSYTNEQLGLSGFLGQNPYRKRILNGFDASGYTNSSTVASPESAAFKGYKGDLPVIDDSKTELGWGDKISGWFTPGEGGASLGGNVLSGVGTAVGIGSGLASMYYAKKEADLKKDKAKMEKDAYQRGVQREAEAENRMQQFAKNAGNGAFYK